MDELAIIENAFSLYEEEKYAECIETLHRIAETNVQAQVCLGMIYWHNHVADDNSDSLALYWYTKAAENGQGLAQLWLANNYSIGLKSETNPELAVYWYQKAAAKNITVAQYRLAICYSSGWGIQRDKDKAVALMTKASKKNFFEADLYILENIDTASLDSTEYMKMLLSLEAKYDNKLFFDESVSYRYIDFLLHGIEDTVLCSVNHRRAFTLLSQSSYFYTERGLLLLADCYAKGWGTNQSTSKAREIYQRYSETSRIARAKLLLLSGE